MSAAAAVTPLLRVRDLRLALGGEARHLLVDGVSFDVEPGRVLGIVGESGCGKTVTALSILGLNDPAIGAVGGSVMLGGEDLLQAGEARMRQVRGGEIAMIFQEPMTSLNPVFTIGAQIVEALRAHRPMPRATARAAAIELLALVGIPSPRLRIDHYPHQMSGGMRQRAMIAMALAGRPRLLIADEPTTALDVTIQAQIIALLRRLQAELGMAIIFISHDLGLVSGFADEVIVMYAGRVIEAAPAAALFARPLHPYSERLMASIPPIDRDVERLAAIPGSVPPPSRLPPGCRFAPRCALAEARCRASEPPLRELEDGRRVACILAPDATAPHPG